MWSGKLYRPEPEDEGDIPSPTPWTFRDEVNWCLRSIGSLVAFLMFIAGTIALSCLVFWMLMKVHS